MGKQREWTITEIKRAKQRVEAGETWDEVSADMGVHTNTLRKQVYRVAGKLDLSKRQHLKKNRDREKLLLSAVALRNGERLSWSLIAERVGWSGDVEALRQAVRRYAKKHGLKLTLGLPAVRRTKWDNRE